MAPITAVEKRMKFYDISLAALTMIHILVEQDEGGWKLNEPDANDADGGWTYAGVTANLYNSYFNVRTTRKFAEQQASDHTQQWDNDIYEIYFNEFYLPLQEVIGGPPHQGYLSAAVNVGLAHATEWIRLINSDQPWSVDRQFCKLWRNHYIKLVVDNSTAWFLYAFDNSNPKPKTLRAKYLQGWMNRVDKYS